MTFKQIAVRLPRMLDKDLNEVGRLRPKAQSIELNITPLSTASLTLEDGSGVAIRSFVELYNAKGSVGIFRVNMPDESYGSGERIALEHGICTLDDAIISGQGEITGTPADVLRQILTHQTTKARGQNIWILGTVEAPESMTITAEHDGTKTLEMLAKAMQELQGYMLTFDQGAFPWVVNVVKKPETVACEGRLSRNIRTIRKTMDDSDLCTRLYCSLLDGGYIESDTIGVWGEVEQSITLNDDMPKDDAIAYCQRYLDNRKNPVLAVQMDATEWFTLTGERLDRFEIGDVCRIALPEYGVTLEERIVALSYTDALGTPELATVSLANQIEDMSIRSAKTTQDVDSLKSTSTSYGSRISTSENNITNLKDTQEKIEELNGKMTHWFNSVEIDLDAETATIGLLASRSEVTAVSTRLTQAEIEIDGANANISLKANATTVDALGERVSSAEIEIDGLNSEINLKADKITLDGYVTASQLETKFTNFESGISDSLYVSALSANGFECSKFSFKGYGMSLSSMTVVTGVKNYAGYNVMLGDGSTKIIYAFSDSGNSGMVNRDTIYYMDWE